ncbi:hypothetical protein D0Z00_000249 [Geotrichum galactomycetum]|uniref:Uncharacterized protein n=1 Tax=Geotrichum galactomycetum TaxID=27317 RepID=A0ACB6VAC3_9ASCO|nr:hypothetical protein D0Z00_000249 [Geotrichum candidum]
MISFFAEVDDIKKSLVQYDDNVERIESLHKRSLDDISGEEANHNQVTALMDETRALSLSLRDKIKSLESRSQRDNTKKVQAENVKHQFTNSIRKYQAVEANFRQKYKERAERQYKVVFPEATDDEVQKAISESENGQIFAEAVMSSNRRGQAEAALSEVQTRHRDIQQISRTMNELAELFDDMQQLVAEQEPIVATIENKAQEAQQDIEGGVAQTNKAVKSARAMRKKKWWCLLILVIIAVILIAVLVPTLKK